MKHIKSKIDSITNQYAQHIDWISKHIEDASYVYIDPLTNKKVLVTQKYHDKRKEEVFQYNTFAPAIRLLDNNILPTMLFLEAGIKFVDKYQRCSDEESEEFKNILLEKIKSKGKLYEKVK